MSNIALNINNISKRYRLGVIGRTTLQDDISRKWSEIFSKKNSMDQKKLEKEFVWALKNISLKVKKGEIIGIIGNNGSGKSTLLKILSRITAPESGEINIYGRTGSLLEVGTGFHPELTGIENIYLNGAILGMTKSEIDQKIEKIIEFSEVSDYVDTPVKRYSSGMTVRLAFSVAAHLDPEILIVDEVLAVGDASFQRKCIEKMKEISTVSDKTILFVSHNMETIKNLCERVILLNNGVLEMDGEPEAVVNHYLQMGRQHTIRNSPITNFPNRLGSGELKIYKIQILNSEGNDSINFVSGDKLIFNLFYKIDRNLSSIRDIRVVIDFYDSFGKKLFRLVNQHFVKSYNVKRKEGCFNCIVPKIPLSKGEYFISAYVMQLAPLSHVDTLENFGFINIENGDFFGSGMIDEWPEYFLVDQKWEHIE